MMIYFRYYKYCNTIIVEVFLVGREHDSNVRAKKEASMSFPFRWIAGVLFTFFIAFLGFMLTFIPGFSYLGQLATAIIIAIIYSQIFGYPEFLRPGITFSSKVLLRVAIILYGLRLNIHTVLGDGLGLLVKDMIVIAFAILFTMYLAKVFKADKTISLLAGVGTGVCGAAAIAAIAPIIKAKDEDTAISVGMIALVGTLFSILYILIKPFLPLTDIQYGIWSGMSLHELAHVALAAEPAGEDALAMALLAKLGRVFLLIPLSFIIIFIVKRTGRFSKGKQPITFPWFLLGFVMMSVLGTFVFGKSIPVSENMMNGIYSISTWLLTAAMVGLGLSVNLQSLRTKALRPFMAMLITSVLLSMLAFIIL